MNLELNTMCGFLQWWQNCVYLELNTKTCDWNECLLFVTMKSAV